MNDNVISANFSPHLRDAAHAMHWGNWETAVRHMRKAARQTERDGSDDLPRVLAHLGSLLMNMERYPEAHKVFGRRLKATAKFFGKNSYEYAVALSDVGAVWHWEENFAEAKPILLRAERLLNDLIITDIRASHCYCLLAMIVASEGNMPEALQYLGRTRAIQGDYLEYWHPDRMRTLMELSIVENVLAGKEPLISDKVRSLIQRIRAKLPPGPATDEIFKRADTQANDFIHVIPVETIESYKQARSQSAQSTSSEHQAEINLITPNN